MISIDVKKELYGSEGKMFLDVQVEIQEGEFVALMGESGAGKTTLLRIIAGLETSQGDIVVEGRSWKNVPVQKREIGFVFQDYALFDNMNVIENLLFVNKDKNLAEELLEMTGLTALKSRNVTALSGGQKQRVSLCRAMMKKPKLLLMDEPLSALDTKMRRHLQSTIKSLHKRFKMTTIMVSHDTNTVFDLCSRVLVLDKGNIIKDGSMEEVLAKGIEKYRVEVLSLKKDVDTTVATVSLFGEYFKVKVKPHIQVGEKIDITLKGQTV